MRMESGCEDVVANEVHNALYIAFGNDPYEMLETAYATISQASGSFRTRKTKPLPPGVDTFGWCSWDAFYSSVDTKKVSAAVDSLAKIGYAPKFVIIDDGWQSVAPASSHRATAKAASDGDLSGAQIDGSVALQSTKGGSNPIMQFIQSEVLRFYSEKVEKGKPDSLSVKIWSTVSRTLLKDKLLDFFALKTDFSKRLTSWKANSKFEDALSGQTFKKFVKGLKERRGINQVFVWHALSGYWGGISDDAKDDLPKELTRSKYDNSTEFTTSCDLSEVRIKYSKPTPHLLLVEPALAWDPGSLAGVGSVALGSLSQLYERMHKYLADAGVDGVKVDAQSGIGAFGQGYGGGSTFARTVVRAVEDSVKTAFAKLPEAPTLYSRFFQSSKKVPESQFHLEGCMCHRYVSDDTTTYKISP
jgi:raffinose synthase